MTRHRTPRLPRLTAALTAAALSVALAGAGTPTASAAPTSARPDAGRNGAQHSLRTDAGTENYYFVMADRFNNGSTANDLGGLPADRMVSGFDPTSRGFYHGGDLRGIAQKLDYIQGLGTTAIWLTPSFKNKAVQVEDGSAGYHGYWVTDFTQIDPHLGTNAELASLIRAAHRRGMKVYFDIITNHTADVIGFAEGARVAYRSKSAEPYRDAAGNVFDDAAVAGSPAFPELDADVSFPYQPVLEPGEENLKVPGWLNDVTLYHNRGDSSFAGESSTYGDFVGLDDLFTEDPQVVDGMIDIYKTWIGEFGVDGFRIDTMKHVNDEFWQAFGPEVLAYARSVGKKDFFMFGEVYDTSRDFTSEYTTANRMQAVLDFPFQQAARSYASASAPATTLRTLFVNDDWYTDADSNVYSLPTFLGNHDMGRIGSFIAADNASASDDEKVARDTLAHALMYFSRGNPVIYYGDEQGFTGDGGDQLARQDMFASRTPEYLDDDLLGTTATHARDNFVTSHPLYRNVARLAQVVRNNPTLRMGAHQDRYAEETAGVYAFSRIEASRQREYVVALNNTATARTASVPTYIASHSFAKVYGDANSPARLRTARDRTLSITVPAFSAVVYGSARRIPASKAAPTPALADPVVAGLDGTRLHLVADLPHDSFYEVTFQTRTAGGSWTAVGTDDTYPYQVFHETEGMTPGTALEYRAVVLDNARHTRASAIVTGTVPEPVDPNAPTGPAPQPLSVTIVGDLQSEAGCTADGQPDCEATQATYDPFAQEWRLTVDLPAGSYAYRTLLNGSADEGYGAGGTTEGADLTLTLAEPATVTFTYRHGSHLTYATTAADQPGAVSVPGSLNSEMGCAADWDPACPQAQLTYDPEQGVWRGTYDLPAGSYAVKAALDSSWDVNYGDGGALNGPNIAVEHPGGTITFSYNEATHLLSFGWPITQPTSVSVPGSYQSEAGCATDWDPACAATAATWDERSGGWILRVDDLPAGEYAVKVALNGTWDVNYGENGAPNGPNIPVSHDGGGIAFRYDPSTHLVTVVQT